MALALDTAISCMEHDYGSTVPVPGITKSLKQDALIHLRTLRSAALRANRDAAPAEYLPFNLISGAEKTA